MGTRNGAVEVDLDGLAKLWAKNKSRVLFELISNAHDPKGTTEITVHLAKVNPDGADRLYRIQVVDNNPTGFTDLSHSWTMFADSEKKNDPDALGMFNLGEKLVIAVAKEVTIITVNKGVRFDDKGRHPLRKYTGCGSAVEVLITLTEAEYTEMCDLMKMFIPRDSVKVSFNGQELPRRTPITCFEMTLPVPLADSIASDMRMSKRKCLVDIYEPLAGETPHLYGLGIPVVENNSKWHYMVHQKVPVPFDRDNVPPSYLHKLHVECVNHMHTFLMPDDVNETFVKVALEDEQITGDAFRDIRIKKHGEKVVIHDPNFPEATKRAIAEGYVPLYGKSESTGFFGNNRRFGDVKTAQEVTPQAVPFGDGPPLKLLDPKKMTVGMRLFGEFACMLFRQIVSKDGMLSIIWANDSGWPYSMTFGKVGLSGGGLTVNVGRLGYEWFNRAPADTADIIDLLIHEFGHYYKKHPKMDDHLSSDYYNALTALAGRATVLALQQPKLFTKFRAKL